MPHILVVLLSLGPSKLYLFGSRNTAIDRFNERFPVTNYYFLVKRIKEKPTVNFGTILKKKDTQKALSGPGILVLHIPTQLSI